MKFLKGLRKFWLKISVRTNRANQEAVGGHERLSRYIFSRKHFKVTKNEVEAAAFMPASDGDTSVFRVGELTEREIWDVGIDHVEAIRQKSNPQSLKARADINASVIFEQGLTVSPETSSHKKHANISGWPVGDHSAMLLKAGALALKASLRLRPIDR